MISGINLHINRLGPIVGPVKVELRPFMIFSGISGVGKSYLSLLVHYIYRVLTGDELNKILQLKELNYEQLRAALPHDSTVLCKIPTTEFMDLVNLEAVTYLREMLGNPDLTADFKIEFPDLPEHFTFLYGRSTLSLDEGNIVEHVETLSLKEMDKPLNLPTDSVTWGTIPFRFLISLFLREKYGINVNATFFMPPSRGSLISLPESVRATIKGMYREFLNDMSAIKNLVSLNAQYQKIDPNFKKAQNVLHNRILRGDIMIDDDEIVYKLDSDNLTVPISAAASSIKELAPFAIMMQKGYLGQYATLFEEPESHLHPELQVKVAELLCYAINSGAHLQITTHSDYLLRHINDMIRLGIIRSLMKDVNEFIRYAESLNYDSFTALSPDLVGAYYIRMRADGLSEIEHQDSSMGVPFDTFRAVIDSNMQRSSQLYDDLESMIDNRS